MEGTEAPRGRYTPLSSSDVAAILPGLPGWTGDQRRLLLDVVVRDPDALLAEVAAAETELNHHAEVERVGAALSFRVWTHVRGVVTRADVELAERISHLVRKHGTGT